MAWNKGKGGMSSASAPFEPAPEGRVPAWLKAGLTSGGLVQPTGAGKGGRGGKCGKGGKGPVPGSLGGNVPSPLPDRPVPAWLAAKPQQPIGSNVKGCGKARGGPCGGKGSGRLRIMDSRIHGTLTEWNGNIGWVKPAEPINHPDAKKNAKGLQLSRGDTFPPGAELTKGMQVTYFVYHDGLKLGAEKCMEFKGSYLGQREEVKEKPEPRKTFDLGKAAGSGKNGKDAAKGAKGGNKGTWVFVPDVYQPQFEKRPAKGEGKQKQDGKGKKALPRTRVTKFESVTGIVIEWEGTHGFIEPDIPIDHPKAKEKLYIHQKDIVDDPTGELYIGQVVNFHVYADRSGLGAEECVAC